jgi:hypothetical protein
LAVAALDAAGAGSGLAADLARHDAAVVRLEALRAQPAALINLDRLFADSNAAIRSDALWDLVATFGEADQDPRIRAAVERFRAVAREALLDQVVSALSSVALPEPRLADVIAAIQSSGVPRDRINAAIGRLLEPITTTVTAALAQFDADWHTLVPDENREATPQERVTLERLRHIAESDLLPQVRRLRSLAPSDAIASLTDLVADRVVALSFAVLVTLKDGWQALALVDTAASIASPKLRKEIQEGRAAVEGRVYALGLVQSLQAEDWPLALAYINLIQTSPDRADSAELAQLAVGIQRRWTPSPASITAAKEYIRRSVANPSQATPRHALPGLSVGSSVRTVGPPSPPAAPRRRVWPWVVGVGAVALLLFALLLFNVVNGDDRMPPWPTPSRPTSTSARATSTSARATSTPACRQLLAQYEDQRDALKTQIANIRGTMTVIEATIAPHATEIAWIKTNYPSMELPPDLDSRYQDVINQYNAGNDNWQRLDVDKNRKIDAYSQYVDLYNELLQTC